MSIGRGIAIVGMGGVFPGSADLEGFWDVIASGRDTAREAPAGRWLLPADVAYHPERGRRDHVYSKRACFLDAIPPLPAGLDIERDLLTPLDPMVHIALHAAAGAVGGGRLDGIDRQRVGVILGNIALPTEASSAQSREILGASLEAALFPGEQPTVDSPQSHPLDQRVAALPGAMVANAFGLGGGFVTLDAACASSLYAIALACDELSAGRADAMLAGGLSRPDSLYTQMGFSQLTALSESGRCSPFDHKGDGLVVGEGAGVFLLRRLDDAVRDGLPIHGVIRGFGLSNDVGGSLLAPRSEGQLRALRDAYADAGWSPHDVDLIECHATGTPIGDATELASLRELWGENGWHRGQCIIGGVKSNVGHLLTGAGAAGLMKVLLALSHEQLPPTANFERAADEDALAQGPFRVLSRAEPWRAPEHRPRRAGVTAFGFGGINAHILVEEWRASHAAVVEVSDDSPAAEPIAVVGIDAAFGPWSDLASVRERLLGFEMEPTRPSPAGGFGVPRSRFGALLEGIDCFDMESLEVPLRRFRIPPSELQEMLPQQLLMLLVAARALESAGWNEELGIRTGTFIGIELDPHTNDFSFRWSVDEHARRWNDVRRLSLGADELVAWTNELRDGTLPPLTADRTMGALGGIVASRIAREFRIGGPSFTVSCGETSGLRAIEIAVRALRSRRLDSAVVGAVDLACDVRTVLAECVDGDGPFGEGAAAVVLQRLSDARRQGRDVRAVIRGVASTTGTGSDTRAQAAASAEITDAAPVTVIPGAGADLGHAGAASGMGSFIKAVLGLDARVAIDGRPTRHWLRNSGDGPRRTAVLERGFSGDSACVILDEGDAPASASGVVPEDALFVCEGDDAAGVAAALAELRAVAQDDQDLNALARRRLRDEPIDPSKALALTMVARDREQLQQLLELAATAVETGSLPSHATSGSRLFYSTSPLGRERVAFVFPGSGNHYPGMGRRLALAWPDVLLRQDRATPTLKDQMLPDVFWDGDLGDATPQDLIFGQVTFGAMMSDLVRRFGVEPSSVIGYSLGETAGYFALGVWSDRDEMLRRMRRSSLFREDLAGPCRAARRVWGIDPDADFRWRVGVVDRSPSDVRAAITPSDRVAHLITNTPRECVIGGERDAVDVVVRRLGATFHPLSGVSTVHCSVVEPVADEYRALHLFSTTPPAKVDFYGAAAAQPYAVTPESAAESITRQALEGFDFPAVIENAYAAGMRVFLELGPGTSCTRMISTILGDRPHAARSLNVPGPDEDSAFIRGLAWLIAERVPVDPSPLTERLDDAAPADPQEPVESFSLRDEPFTAKPPRRTPRELERPAPTTTPVVRAVPAPILQLAGTQSAAARAQDAFLRLAASRTTAIADQVQRQMTLLGELGSRAAIPEAVRTAEALPSEPPAPAGPPPALDRERCLAFAIGRIGDVLGPEFAAVDGHPTRVRLPDEPLMLVDRILEIDAEPRTLGHGRVVTEHDVLPGAWYLDGNRIPTCIAVEAGQADLFLSGYLGIDLVTRGLAVYRLLDAEVTFHGPLPEPGAVIHYDISIERFFRQGDTHLFRFRFDGTVDGAPLLTMRNGCAGFFTDAELAAGQGIVHTELDKRPLPGKRPNDWTDLVPTALERYDDEQLTALRRGDLAACFGDAFANLAITKPYTLPGGRMKLVDRVVHLDPTGGRFGIGLIRAELDVHPDDWFLTCHFVDDMVMPGTLMYECCLHTLRIFLLRSGWIGEEGELVYEPVPGVRGQLKCRGQVIETTRRVTYEISVKEMGYFDDGTPYVIVDALMYADGKPIVEIIDMSLRLSGMTRTRLESLWAHGVAARQPAVQPVAEAPPLYDHASIRAFAIGKPSEAFGDRYRVFDEERVIARLPGPPYQYLDRITSIEDAEAWKLAAGGTIVAHYDVPPDEWYFAAERSGEMPFAVLLEVALQPCGWFAAYLGSALTSEVDLSFRNLGGRAVQHRPVTPETGTLTTTVKMTSVSSSGGMIIQEYEFAMSDAVGPVYTGDTYFGFFSKEALRNQVGLRDVAPYDPSPRERATIASFAYPEPESGSRLPVTPLRMMDHVSELTLDGGPHGLGFVRGTKTIDPSEWFFSAHFYQDPVWPGSLGLEALLQLMKVIADRRWPSRSDDPPIFSMALDHEHRWTYRGQVIPTDSRVSVEGSVTAVDEDARTIEADGMLSVDGRHIYEMKAFTVVARRRR